MKKINLVLLLLMCFLSLQNAFASTEFGCIFLSINPSTVNAGMGYESGVADIWHENAFSVWSNPALSSFQNGLTYSTLHDKWLDDVEGIDDMTFSSRYINIGYEGIGISFPLSNSDGYTGTSIDYGIQESVDEEGQINGNFHSYEKASSYNFSINTDALNSFKPNFFQLGIGFTFTKIKSKFTVVGRENIINLGVAGKVDIAKALQMNNLVIESSMGYSSTNIQAAEIQYGDSNNIDPILQEDRIGFGVFGALKSHGYLSNSPLPEEFCKYLISAQLLYAKTICGDSQQNSYGSEIGLLDTFFIRNGYYSDKDGSIEGHTYGYGIKLNILDNGFVEFNKSIFPGGEMQDKQDKTDFSVGIYF